MFSAVAIASRALGADRGMAQRLVVRDALSLIVIGLAVGLPLAFLASCAVRRLLFGTAPSDPVAYGVAVSVLVLLAVLAAYVPARRASRLDPAHALKAE